MDRYTPPTTLCVCGHEYQDHKAKRPHSCVEEHATRPGHDCSCRNFQPPLNGQLAWEGPPGPRSNEEKAMSSIVDMQLQAAIRSIKIPDFGHLS